MASTIGLNFSEKRNKAKSLLIGIIILYSIMPIVSRLISDYLTTYSYLILLLLTLALIFFDLGKGKLFRYLTTFTPFVVYAVLTYFTKSDSLILWGYQRLLIILPVCLGMYLNDRDENYVPILIFAYIVTLITTIVGCIIYPNAARILATSESAYELTYSIRNIGGYYFVYSCVLIYPMLIIAYKRGKVSLFVSLIGTILIFVLCLVTEYTIALLLSFVSSLLYFVNSNASPKKMLILFSVSILVIILFSDLFSDLLRYLANNVSSESIKERLNALAGGKTGLESSEDDRIFRYETSLNIFMEYPIFGGVIEGVKTAGGHSSILDYLANFGLMGGIVLVWIYVTIYKLFYKSYSKKTGYGFIVFCFALTLGLSFLNTGFYFSELCLFYPILLRSIYKEKKR